jgi:CheY-like chemotaxis protein
MLYTSTRTRNKGRTPLPRGRAVVFTSETRRILVADDNRDWADGLALLLADQGYSVRAAYDGREALQEARSFRPHAVILDVWMPGMTGFEAGRVFSRHPAGTRPFMIAVTGSPEDSGCARAALAGFDRYLGKSADSAELLEVLRKLWR